MFYCIGRKAVRWRLFRGDEEMQCVPVNREAQKLALVADKIRRDRFGSVIDAFEDVGLDPHDMRIKETILSIAQNIFGLIHYDIGTLEGDPRLGRDRLIEILQRTHFCVLAMGPITGCPP